ncbi:cell wall hydrolase [Alterisphingorhabdus coralli]|uniref:Cell wall hydrolase n=1 Tax=Alterisphingorhabdus coralli TaxID=3071408 RepID=A0AA97F6T3_9SPHN|nr:cell wall hydrolase [Parasphingorhabdus sp. SCSIO 66989]WOE75464.1 cell wall hydrolase [Parasphingorhabdus sp. SCSIO 66989]
MSKKLQIASAVAVTASTLTVLMTGDVGLAYDQMIGNAAAQEISDSKMEAQVAPEVIIAETEGEDGATDGEIVADTAADGEGAMVQPLPADYKTPEEKQAEAPVLTGADSLRELVRLQDGNAGMDEQLRCLAGAVYFESKGESLRGQLAVAHVVKARKQSSRFPNSYCGVVYQRSQFSFVRGGKMPRINTGSQAWANAKAIARIADQDAWKSDVDGALFFHARYVNPRWRLTRIAQIDNHVFYR